MASVTINFSAENAARIQTTLVHIYGLDRPATLDDLKAYVIQDVKQLVRNAEREIASIAAAPGFEDVDIT